MGGKGSGNPALKAVKAENVDPDDNRRVIAFLNEFRKLPRVDFSSLEAVEERTDLFLEKCAEHGMRPLLVNYALALGIDRYTLLRIRQGDERVVRGITPETRLALKKTAALIEATLANQLVTAKSGQVGLIFALKQHGWKDSVEITTSAGDDRQSAARMLESGKTPEEVAAYYLAAAGVDKGGEPVEIEPEAVYEVPKGGEKPD